jgi:hypothetical protein
MIAVKKKNANLKYNNLKDIVVLIPAHNEQQTISKVIQEAKSALDSEVVVIDDASKDNTAHTARTAGATVLPLSLQLGAWGATQTGIRYALNAGYQTAITMDADGQHQASYLSALLKPIAKCQADVVIGACPDRASRARRIAWSYFRLLTRLSLRDITSGFRAYNQVAMEALASREASLLDYQDVGVLLILRRAGLRIIELTVPMNPRLSGSSRVFSSWLVVGNYLLKTTILCIARVGMKNIRTQNAGHPKISS